MSKQRLLSVLFLMSLVLCLSLGQVSAQVANSSIQQGLEHYQRGDFQGTIAIWNTALNHRPDAEDRIVLLKYLARVYSQVGQFEQAIASLDPVIANYQKTGDLVQRGRMMTEQAQAYSSLGQQRKAIALLCGDEPNCRKESALAIARQQSDQLGEAAGLGSLGNIYRLQGEYETALKWLKQSLAIAEKLQNSAYIIAAKNGLGSTYANLAKRDYRYAEFAAETADQTASDKFTQQAIETDRTAIQFFEANRMAAGYVNRFVSRIKISNLNDRQIQSQIDLKLASNRELALSTFLRCCAWQDKRL